MTRRTRRRTHPTAGLLATRRSMGDGTIGGRQRMATPHTPGTAQGGDVLRAAGESPRGETLALVGTVAVPAGGDGVIDQLDTIQAQSGFSSVDAAGDVPTLPLNGVYLAEVDIRWTDGYRGGGTVQLLAAGDTIDPTWPDDGPWGRWAGTMAFAGQGGDTFDVQVTAADGDEHDAEVTVRLALVEKLRTIATGGEPLGDTDEMTIVNVWTDADLFSQPTYLLPDPDRDVMYVMNNGTDVILTINISDPTNPTLLDKIQYPTVSASGGRGFAYNPVDQYLYYLSGSGDLHVIDVSDPSDLSVLSATSGVVSDFFESWDPRGYLYSAGGTSDQFYSTDVSDPLNPFIADQIGIEDQPNDCGYPGSGDYAYATIARSLDGVTSVDVSDPTNLVKAQFLAFGNARAIDFGPDDVAYVTTIADVLVTLDISDPTNMAVLDTLGLVNDVKRAIYADGYVFGHEDDQDRAFAVDASDPTDLVYADSVADSADMDGPTAVAYKDGYLYVGARWSTTLVTIDVPWSREV